jgi:hypothetical protein
MFLLSFYNSGDNPLSLPPLLFLFYTSLTLISGKYAVTVICIYSTEEMAK